MKLSYFISPNEVTVVEDPAPLLRPLLLVELAVAVEATVEAAAVNVAVVAGGGTSGSGGWPAFLKILLIDDTDGIEFGSHTLWASNWSRISQANKPGLSVFKRRIRFTTDGVATCWNWLSHYRIAASTDGGSGGFRLFPYLRFGSTDGTWFNWSRFVKSR